MGYEAIPPRFAMLEDDKNIFTLSNTRRMIGFTASYLETSFLFPEVLEVSGVADIANKIVIASQNVIGKQNSIYLER